MKKNKMILILIMLLICIGVMFTGCDSRVNDEVTLTFSITNNLNENGSIDSDIYNLQVRLIGKQDFIRGKRIDIDYDSEVFTLTGETNTDRYLLTKEDGISIGELNVISELQSNVDYRIMAIYEDQIIEQIIRLPIVGD